MGQVDTAESALAQVNTQSRPSELKITDMRCVDVVGAPMQVTLLKLYTNQGLVGFGEVRDGASRNYALQLKSRLLGENPCDVDRLFRKIKQFGGHARQAGGVSGIEVALWDLAGKAYGVPVYQMLGGKFRDRIRMYCDTDVHGKDTGLAMGEALKKRMELGYTFLKMDLGISQIIEVPGALNAPLGYVDDYRACREAMRSMRHEDRATRREMSEERRRLWRRWQELNSVAHPFTGNHLTEKGLALLDEYMAEVRAVIGDEVPLAIDHVGHIGVEDCIKLAQRLGKHTPAWLEDMIPWQLTEQYARLARATTVPICTGEDIFLKENFRPLLEAGGVSVVHPDVLSTGGILETKKIGDLAQDYGVAMAIHMAESPIGCLAAVHAAAATENFLTLEFHSVDVPWWNDLVNGLPKPIVDHGYITVPSGPGLGIESLNDEVIAEHLHPRLGGMWDATEEWDRRWSANDRLWS